MLVTAIVDGQKGDGQMVNMHVRLSSQLWFPAQAIEEWNRNRGGIADDVFWGES